MQVIKVLGIMTVVGAFAIAAFPTSSLAAPASLAGGADYGKASITVWDASSPTAVAQLPVKGATIEIANTAGNVVAVHTTDASGNVRIGLAEGFYKVRISAKGYSPAGAYLEIKNGQVTNLSIGLTRVPVTNP